MITRAAQLDRLLHAMFEGRQGDTALRLAETVSDKQLVESLCAVANMPTGGTLVFGLGEHGGSRREVVDPEQVEHRVQTLAAQRITPGVQVHSWQVVVDAKPLVIVSIAGRHDRLHRVAATNTRFVRQDRENLALAPRDIGRIAAGQSFDADRQPVNGSSKADLDWQLTQAVVDTAQERSPHFRDLDRTQILRMLGVVEPAGDRLTLAGLYALGAYPQQFFPNLSLTATKIATDGDQTRVRECFTGPLPQILDDAVRWVVRQAQHKDVESHSGYRATRIPLVALRETLANALIHRDLSPAATQQPVELHLDGQTVTVRNPGRLWNVHLTQLGERMQNTEINALLYNICQLTPLQGGHPIITEPGDLRRVQQSLTSVGIEPVAITDNGLTCTATLGWPATLTATEQAWIQELPQPETLTKAEQHVLVSLLHANLWTPEKLVTTFGAAGTAVVEKHLDSLVNRGFVEKITDNGQQHYQLHPVWAQHAATHYATRYNMSEPTTTNTTAASAEREDDRAHRAAATSKHGATLWHALGNSQRDVHDLAETTGLSASQIRYAMQRLITKGLVERSGGQGHRHTTYQRTAG